MQSCLAFAVAGRLWPEKFTPLFEVLLFPWAASHRTVRANQPGQRLDYQFFLCLPPLAEPSVAKNRRYRNQESSDMLLYLAGINEHAVLRIVGSKRWSVAHFLRTIQYLFEYGVRFLTTWCYCTSR